MCDRVAISLQLSARIPPAGYDPLALVLVRMLAHLAGKENQRSIGVTDARYLDACCRPRERARFWFRRRRQNLDRVGAALARVPGELRVTLPDRHRDDVRSDAREDDDRHAH